MIKPEAKAAVLDLLHLMRKESERMSSDFEMSNDPEEEYSKYDDAIASIASKQGVMITLLILLIED